MNWNFPEALDPHLVKRCAPLPLELAEARKAIVLSVCCGMFFTASLACNAQTFGDVRVNESRNLTQGAPDSAISRWLMRLPADENSVERSGADAGLRGAILDDNPIGGELHGLITPARSNEFAERLLAAGCALILDPHPIGGEVYHLSSRTIVTRRPGRDLTAGIPKRERGISVGHRLRGSTDNREIADLGAVKAGHRAVPLGSPARGIHSTRTRGSSRPLVAVRARAGQTPAPSPAPVTPIQPAYPYYWQSWDWGYPQTRAPPAAQ